MSATADLPATPAVTSRAVRLDRALADLLGQAPELQAAAVVSFDGLPMASALPNDMDEDRVAAMSAALLSLGDKAAQGLGRGELSQVYIAGETGTVFLISAEDEAVLVAVAGAGAKVGLMLYEVRRAAAAVGSVLQEDTEPVVDAGAAPAPEPALWAAPELPPEPAAATEPVLAAAPEPAPWEPNVLPEPTAAPDQSGEPAAEPSPRTSPMYLAGGRHSSPVHEALTPPSVVDAPEPAPAIPGWSPYSDQPAHQP
jgi:predicted regulator of Ras-like GTPase activity (Roadblock/LC7/MglB family)